MQRFLLSFVAAAALVGLTACSSLTRPDDISISAEPIGVKPAPAPPPAAPKGMMPVNQNAPMQANSPANPGG